MVVETPFRIYDFSPLKIAKVSLICAHKNDFAFLIN